MAATYEPIASTTLGSDSAAINFTSIPSSYTDLIILGMVYTKFSGAPANSGIWVELNADSGSNYSHTELRGDGSSASSVRGTNTTSMRIAASYTTSNSTTLDFTPIRLQFLSYANTNVYKTALGESAVFDGRVSRRVGLWRSTSAITSISVFTNATSIMAGSVLSLFGIKAA